MIELALKELKEFFPTAAEAEAGARARGQGSARDIFGRARSGGEAATHATAIPNLFLAGDWTRSGWPATMEGAVRSGYLAAEAVAKSFGNPQQFLLVRGLPLVRL